MNTLWKSASSTFFARVYAALINFLILILTARILGPEERGLIATTLAYANLLAGVFGFSIGSVIVHRFTDSNNKPPAIGSLLGNILVILTVSTVLIALFGLTNHQLSIIASHDLVLLLACLAAPLLIATDYFKNLHAVSGHLNRFNFVSLLCSSLLILLVLLALYFYQSWVAILVAMLFSHLFLVVVATHTYSRANFSLGFDPQELMQMLKGGGKLHANTIGSFLLFNMDVLMLNHLASTKQAGLYDAAVQLAAIPLFIPNVLTLAFYSEISKVDPDRFWPEQKKVIMIVMGIYLALLPLMFWLSPHIFIILLGNEFQDSADVFRILLLALTGMGLSQLMTAQWITRGFFVLSSTFTLLIGITNICLNLYFIPIYGMKAAAWTSTAAFTISLLINLFFIIWIERRSAIQAPLK